MEISTWLFGESAAALAGLTRFVTPVLALLILLRCVRSMLSERYEPETWAYLFLPGEVMVPLRHWECILGRAPSSDAVVEHPSVEKMHACLIRDVDGRWRVYGLGRGPTKVNGRIVEAGGLEIADADVLTLGQVPARFVDLTEEERGALLKYRHRPGAVIRPAGTLLLLTAFDLLLALQHLVLRPGTELFCVAGFGLLAAVQWVYFCALRVSGQRGFEPELLAFFMTTVGYSVIISASPTASAALKQLVLIGAGVGLFLALGLWMRDLKRVQSTRLAALAAALALFALNVLVGTVSHGSRNWISIGGFTFQPSEMVKLLYIYAGAATLDRLFVNKNLLFFIGFSAACVGALALMGDFGAAIIFFITFLVISFMRSGSFATVLLAVTAAVLAAFLVLTVKPYVLARFQTWGHAWEDVNYRGYQQVRAMSAAASGGLFGTGAGAGWFLRSGIEAADSDLVFGGLCQEQGLLTGLCCVLSLVALAGFAVKNAGSCRSSYHVIAAAGAVSLLLVQMSFNVFGAMDILPFTGVTFPFVSHGGTSLLSCWGMIALIKGADTRAGASFAVKRPERFSGGAGVTELGPPPPARNLPAGERPAGGGVEWLREEPGGTRSADSAGRPRTAEDRAQRGRRGKG